MRQLPPTARIYLVCCYVCGLAALSWCLFTYRSPITVSHWLVAGGLSVIAAACQVFVVTRKSTDRQRNDHLTLAPLFAALLLLPRPLLALVIIIAFIPEWFIYRRKWFGQLFNISVYLIAATVSRFALFLLTGEYRFDSPDTLYSLDVLRVLAVVPIFEITQVLLLALVFKLVAGQSFSQTGLFEPRSLLLEVGLICLGIGFATSYVINPLYGFAAALPLLLIFDALHVPNLKEEAATDPKTGLANMRHFNAAIARDLERAERTGQPLSLLVCDLDYLRNINNTYGHQAGDIVLVGIANIIKRCMRGGDVAARFGGEEFVILLPETNADDGWKIAERLRQELQEAQFDVGHSNGPISATMSIGIASYPRDGRTHEALMHESDLAVYQAKRDGRNRVVVAGRESRELVGEWSRDNLLPPTPLTPRNNKDTSGRLWKFVDQATRTTLNNQAQSGTSTPTDANTELPSPSKLPLKSSSARTAQPRVLVFIAVVAILALTGLLPGLSTQPVPWVSLSLFALLTVLAEQLAITITGKNKISVSVVTILGAAFLHHELGILVTTVAAVVSMAVKARSPLHRAIFNFGMILLSGLGAHWCFQLLAQSPFVPSALGALLIPAVMAGGVYYAVNQVLICMIRGLHEGQAPWKIWLAEYRWLWPHYMVLGALALVIALGYLAFGWIGVLALMAPVAMMHVAMKQYMDRSAVHLEELQDMNGRLSDSYEATLQALTRALDTRDEETEEHSQRVKRYTMLIAEQFQLTADEYEDIARGALLHDIGKIGVPDAILLKPGKLTDEEREIMRKHPEIGFRMIAHIPFLQRAAQVVLHHHEAWDGSGYPSGLSGLNIPLGARIFAVADAYDAMTSDRPYRRAMAPEMALAEIGRCKGQQFDPQVVDMLFAIPREQLYAVADTGHEVSIMPDLTRLPQLVLT